MKQSRIVMAAAVLIASCSRSNTPPTSAAAVQALDYLSQQEGVNWHHVEANHVFIGFSKPLPKGWQAILNDAALAGNKAIGGEFHASGVADEGENWHAYADSNTVGTATARDSELVE